MGARESTPSPPSSESSDDAVTNGTSTFTKLFTTKNHAELGPRRLTNAFKFDDTVPKPSPKKHTFHSVKIHVAAAKPRAMSKVKSELTMSIMATADEDESAGTRDDSSTVRGRRQSRSQPSTPPGGTRILPGSTRIPPGGTRAPPRSRLIQSGVHSPVDPKTKNAKIPRLPKTATKALVADAHSCTGLIPGGTRSLNMEVHYAACTRAGNVERGKRKCNQDTFFMEDCVGGNPFLHLFGVFDGHGVHGHFVSHAVRDAVLEYIGAKNKHCKENSETLESLLSSAVSHACKKIKGNHINTSFSGSTGTMCIVDSKAKSIVTCNIGDSRILLGRGKKAVADAVVLTSDHDPNLGEERKRITGAGGRVVNFSGVHRVCTATQNLPGLAMSRSFGDDVAGSVGVTCVPDTTKRGYSIEDRFLVLGSDGVFDFLSSVAVSQVVSELMKKKKDPEVAAERLVSDAVKRWQRNDKNYVDDVTAIVVHLNAHPGKAPLP